MTPKRNPEVELVETLGEFAYDPLGFVMWAYPWGEPGTELHGANGPNDWQRWLLTTVRDGILTTQQAIQIAIASGHGIGKSATCSWLSWWAYSTFPGTRGVITANTENQLKTKTWVELTKWHRLFIARNLFKCTATAIFSIDEDQAREWRVDIVPWSERNTEAFAGLHNAGKRLLIIFDEASAIPDIIFETTEGALTDKDTEIIWVLFGNPTRSEGRFRECFDDGKFASRWITRKVDSREVPFTNKAQLAQWAQDYGEDSDFFRVRVRGEFPRIDASSFISRDLAVEATRRVPEDDTDAPVILGVDVARFGDACSVIYPRKGRDAVSRAVEVYSGISTMELVARVVNAVNAYSAEAVFVDGSGIGGGVIDRLRDLRVNVYEVQPSGKPQGAYAELSGVKYANWRVEMWGAMRNFLHGGSIPDKVYDRDLVAELVGPTYALNGRDEIQLETKAMMKRRGLDSPDVADALALTFALPMPKARNISQTRHRVPTYDPYNEKHIYGGFYEET